MKKLLLIIFFSILINCAYAIDNDIQFFWSLGDMGVSFESKENDFKAIPFINVGNINWITKHGLGWGFHVFNIEGSPDWKQALILPLELNYSPFGYNKNFLFLTLYARGGWLVNYDNDITGSMLDRSSLFGAAGLRTAWIPKLEEHWSIFTGAFIEYTSKNEIRMGISLDTSVIVVLTAIAFGIAFNEEYEDDE